MSIWTRLPTAVLIIASVVCMAVLTLAIGSTDAAGRDIMGDWVISDGITRVSNETIDVRGNVLIMDGGHLWLENSTLIINGSQDGEFGLEVNRTGYLEAYNTEILGSPGRYWIRCYNDTILRGCSLHHLHGTPTDPGVALFDGDITMRDTVIRDALWTCLAVYTDLTLLNVTFRDIQYRQMYVINTLLSGTTTISVEDCTFDGRNSVSGRSSFGIQVATYGGYEDIIMSVRNTHFEFLVSGMNIGCYDVLDLTVEDCTLVDCWKGFDIRQGGATVTLRRNVMLQAYIYVTAGGVFDLFIEDNVIEQVETGVFFSAVWAGSYEASVENVTLRNCTNGISAAGSAGGGSIEITVRNSTLETVGTGFVAGQEVKISVHDTVHVPGSGSISGTGSWIKAYTTLDVREVVWRDGPSIEEGDLLLKDGNDVTVTVLDIGGLQPREVLGWQRTATESVTRFFLHPTLEIDDHWFGGVFYNIWSLEPTTIEIIDDVPPEVTISYPLVGAGINSSTLSATGGYTELGSGLAYLDRSIDGGPFRNFTIFADGRWNLTVPGMVDGDHSLSVRGVDATGRVGNVSFVEFVMDTLPPLLDISPPPSIVNVTHVMLEGRVEPGSRLTIDDGWVPLSEDGSFTIGVYLDEGPND
ncbi:MAG: hypothetical protein KAJ35_10260, partial [Thermoplasmata archaeon]|nr:hypothetical protein [Thermoplasmata archaeon]